MPPPERTTPRTRSSQWLSQDLSAIDPTVTWDLLIVGSGYGAAMAAHTLAGCRDANGHALRIAMLERGREHLPGAFPSSVDELPAEVRISRAGRPPLGRRDALFDLRLAGDVNALVANGLGGGSLINAGVMVAPRFGAFDSRMPPSLEHSLQTEWLPLAQQVLGAQTRSGPTGEHWQLNSIDRHPNVTSHGALRKTVALAQLATEPVSCHKPGLTVRLDDRDNTHSAVPLATCTLCGDCLTGCNVGAKASLDVQALAPAQQRGMAIYTSCSVLRLHRAEGLWQLSVVHTDPQMQGRRDAPLTLRAHKVVLAAGSLGSTEILLRSVRGAQPTDGLALSPRLGERFSLNGDNVATIRCADTVNAMADEALPLHGGAGAVSPRRVGPEITASLEWPADNSGPGFLVQEFAVPAPLRRLFHELMGTRAWLERLVLPDTSTHPAPRPGDTHHIDPLAIDPQAMDRELLVGLIGHDSAGGRLQLPKADAESGPLEGSLQVHWPDVASDPAMADAYRKLQALVGGAPGQPPRVTPNPLWRLLPESLAPMMGNTPDNTPGSAMTVHPLGGCPMGASAAAGVVDTWGAVYQTEGAETDAWQGSLLVLDGAAVPASLGANPALTIAALSLRASHHWRDAWGWTPACAPDSAKAPLPRPRARSLADCHPPAPPADTQIQIAERLWGVVAELRGPDGREPHIVELSFAFEPAAVAALTQPLHKRLALTAEPPPDLPGSNRLRIFRVTDLNGRSLADLNHTERDCMAVVQAELSGHMDLLARGESVAWWRSLRAFIAYARNRGLRDLAAQRGRLDLSRWRQWVRTLVRLWHLASQAGEVRRFEYKAEVGRVRASKPADQRYWEQALQGQAVEGFKRFTYACGENPWNQLLYLRLKRLGQGLLPTALWPLAPSVELKLDARFLAKQGLPLLRITQQANQVRALSELLSFGLYGLRLFAKLHFWHLRQPDPSTDSRPQRLPGAVKGLPVPEVHEILMQPVECKARVRLTRYRAPAGAPPHLAPLVFIHGYSASGTTFAHNAIEHHAAGHFWRTGRDIWLVDLRTSAGLPSAQAPWALEDVAWADIPVAIDHIAQQVGRERGGSAVPVDVFAHCIGAVMLSMALLSHPLAEETPAHTPHRYLDELARLHGNLRKIVLSQKGFCVDYSDANILRSYLLNQVKSALVGGYQFRPSPQAGLYERLYDALLNTLPYPRQEGSIEHPLWASVPWSVTRRRMDALYERTFNIENMPRAVLEHIDDFFGPINLQTVAQVIHLARNRQISLQNGEMIDLTHLPNWPAGGTLLLSASDNGMVNPNSSRLMAKRLSDDGIAQRPEVLSGGHQDILIGRHAARTWQLVEGFLNER